MKNKKLSISWGKYPKHNSEIEYFNKQNLDYKSESIPYGNGRSYGDSCIANRVIDMRLEKHFISFNEKKGILVVQSGVLLDEIIKVFVPKGWFLKINPGTKYITVGGAIAADIHGKNHHLEGCFSECVNWMKLLTANNNIIKCSEEENIDYFRSTCGGMGLTGIILEAEIQLKRITSKNIKQTTVKTKNLLETFEVFETIKRNPYSVAWIDCLSRNKAIGKSLVMYGDFMNDGNLNYKSKRKLKIPFEFPRFFLNKITVKTFNFLYYHKNIKKINSKVVSLDSFFFPLDNIKSWNKIYGRNGFTQYQFILPKKYSYKGLKHILEEISRAGKGSFLAVLKLYGKENNNFLSFPLEGYSLALDFKIEKGIFEFLNKLDKIVLTYHGRIYLAKDARVSKEVFEKGYPRINNFRKFREEKNMNKLFNSFQSKRVGL